MEGAAYQGINFAAKIGVVGRIAETLGGKGLKYPYPQGLVSLYQVGLPVFQQQAVVCVVIGILLEKGQLCAFLLLQGVRVDKRENAPAGTTFIKI